MYIIENMKLPNIMTNILRFNRINNKTCNLYHNLEYAKITNRLHSENIGNFTQNGSYCVNTGKYTGRSPNDRFIVDSSPSNKLINWGNVNKPIKSKHFDNVYNEVINHYNSTPNIYIFDGFCGTSDKHKKHVRFLTQYAWQYNFVKNMFIRPDKEQSIELAQKTPDFTILNCSDLIIEKFQDYNLNSEAFALFNIDKKIGIIGGTSYAGEMKKGIFSLMNYWLPQDNVLTMHCSSNIGKDNDTALFFGLSGTGKTTLSADPNRYLIGDDEHGWSYEGIFNLEGGCYAKTINLSHETEPDIFNAIKQNTILENVYLNDGNIDFFNTQLTENGRASYPIEHIDNYCKNKISPHPKNIIFLTCDAFGILPPISKLDPNEAMYHFLSGYTAKVAGTERGITEPVATFSACFGEPFLPLHPYKYADLLRKKIEDYGSNVYLVNTGWYKGGYGVGERMKISITRKCIDVILNGDIDKTEFEKIPIFNLNIPKGIDTLDSSILNPINTWENKKDYYNNSEKLAEMFITNFDRYTNESNINMNNIKQYGPVL